MSLDGLLVNADGATSSEMVGKLGHQEAAVWDGFAPLQRVLLVAVTAAAASAARQRDLKEMKRLQLAIDSRDNDLIILHEKTRQLQEHLSFWKEHVQPFCGDMKDTEGIEKLRMNESVSPLLKHSLESTPKCASVILEQYATPQLGKGLRKRPQHIACFKRNIRAPRVENSKLHKEFLLNERWNTSSPEDNYEKTIFLDRLSECPEEKLEALTPQLPLTQLNKMSTPQCPSDQISFKQGGHLGRYCQKGCRRVNVNEKALTSHVPCATVVLQLKKLVKQLLNSDSPGVVTAFASVKRKAQILEAVNGLDFASSTNLLAFRTAIKDFKQSIEQASLKMASLQVVILSMEHVLLPNAATDVSLSEPDACYDMLIKNKEQLESRSMNDELFCRRTDAEERRLSGASDWSIDTSISDSNCTEHEQRVGTNVDSAIQYAVNRTLDDLMAPLNGGGQPDDNGCSSEMVVIEQLLGELENAAAKVASMEAQMKSLKDSKKLSERKKEEAEQKLSKASVNLDRVDLTRQLQLEDSACEDSTCNQQLESYTCKELDMSKSLKDVEARLAICKEACKMKDKAISRLEEEIAVLQGMVLDSRTPQTPSATGQVDPSSQQTFVTSNLLFNLDSPVKVDSPQSTKSSMSSWKGMDELSRVSDSLECEWVGGSCDSERYKLERAIGATENYGYIVKEPGHNRSVHPEKAKNKQFVRRSSAEEARRSTSSREEARRSSSSVEEARRSSSSTEQSGSGPPVRSSRFPQPLKSSSIQARKLKLSNVDSRLPEDSSGSSRRPLSAEGGAGRRNDWSLINKANANVLAGVEPNTPITARKFGGKEASLSHSLDSLNKAKENFAHRRRWM